MRKLTVEAFEDLSRPGGGHAVIRVLGLADVPDDLTFRLRPADGSSALDRPGNWPDGERRPLSTRVTPEGCELLVGPEIVESPHLLPGTLAVLDIPKCAVRAEFLWPSIHPIERPKRRHVVAARHLKDAQADVAEAQPRSAGAGGEPIAFVEATDASSDVPPDGTTLDASEALWRKSLAELPPAAIAGPTRAAGTPMPVTDAALPPHAAGHSAPRWSEEPETKRRRIGRTIQAALLAAAFVAGGTASAILPGQWAGTSPTSSQPIDGGAAPRTGDLLALIEPARTSPQGFDAASAEPQRLLERADALLATPPAGPDLEEARYLLRRYLALSLAQPRTLWALTQLGSLYAEPGTGKRPDFVRAAGVWEVAATLGDPVAMCFLASLQEHGLGTTGDRQAALGWLLSAKAAGGCPGIDEAIGRLRR